MSVLLNTASLNELLSLLGDELRDIARLYVDQLDSELAELDAAWTASDWPRLHRRAHALKGSSGNLGAVALAETASRLEKAAQAGDAALVQTELAALRQLAPATVQALRDGRYVR